LRRPEKTMLRRGSQTLHRRSEAGFSLAELVTVAAVMGILALVTLPVAKFTAKRSREADLRQSLRQMRSAIDEYKRYSDAGLIPVDLGTDGYPKKLEVLVEGVDIVGQVDKKLKLLRRVPIDPMTGKDEWGLRSYQDASDATSWGGEDIYDVYSMSGGVGLNGIPYRKW
jgi:general secretion pathway protein G